MYLIFKSWHTLAFEPWSESTGLRIIDATSLIVWPMLTVLLIVSVKHKMAWRDMEKRLVDLATTIQQTEQTSNVLTIECPFCHERITFAEAVAHVDEHIKNHTNPAHEGKPLAAIVRHPGDKKWSVVFQEKP